ncbi:MAG: peptidylprolyl isomerase [Pseudomonadales bacterium]|nr:peptidylprolyl isomerase [Pseudomonadales bacterium]
MTTYRVLFLLLALGSISQIQASTLIMDKIIAVVDEDVILESELKLRRVAVQSQLDSVQQSLPPEDILNQQIVERLVIESLQLQMAERGGVRISDEELNGAMSSIAQQNRLSLADFRLQIENDGISYVDMRDQIRRELAINRVQQGVMRRRIQVSEQEIKNFLSSEVGELITADEFRLSHILLPFPVDANAEAIRQVKKDAEKLIDDLNQGADFNTKAIEMSAAPDALDFGDLGWRKAVQLPTMFTDIAPQMEIGEIRGPIKSGSGYHILKLMQKRGAQAEGQIPQTQVRHILIKISEILNDEEAEDLAESLRQEIVNGRDFEELAKLNSDDPGSALSGGDLGWNIAGTFVPEFEGQMNNTEMNVLSPVFRSQHGYHFLEVTGKRIEDFSDRYRMGQADNYLRNQKFEEELQTWLREIREDAFVEIRI